MVETTGLVGSDDPFEIQPLCFALEVRMKFVRTQVRTTAARVVFGTLVGADEDVSLEWWHMVSRYTGMVSVLSRSISSVTSWLLKKGDCW